MKFCQTDPRLTYYIRAGVVRYFIKLLNTTHFNEDHRLDIQVCCSCIVYNVNVILLFYLTALNSNNLCTFFTAADSIHSLACQV